MIGPMPPAPRPLLASAALVLLAAGCSRSSDAAEPPLLPVGAAAAGPVVVEVFTSEGCSSCPPADRLLARLDAASPVPGVEVIALEEHVDYWNHLGWKDPFSSAEFSRRQGAYSRAFGRDGVYTPQMVVDGQAELVGSDEGKARAAIVAAARRAKARVTLTPTAGRTFSVEVAGAPAARPGGRLEVWLAIVEGGLATQVPKGENAGRLLEHGPVVRSLSRLGALTGGAFRGEASFPAGVPGGAVALGGAGRTDLRAVAFVQDAESRHILGAGRLTSK